MGYEIGAGAVGNFDKKKYEEDKAKKTTTAPSTTLAGVDSNTTSKMTSSFVPSQAYQNAMAHTNDLLKQLESGRTSYTDQVKGMMDQIMNREDFKYDMESDMLFQNYLDSSMADGKMAMQHTMGQAAALTGGYGSTYATSAANQAYNAYIQDAYDNLPEYYNLALEAYNMEGQEMYNQYAMLSAEDQKEYDRMYSAWSANYTNTQQMYQNEYGEWAGDVSNAFNYAGMLQDQYRFNRQQELADAQALIEAQNKENQFDYDKLLQGTLEAYNRGGIDAAELYSQSYNYGSEQNVGIYERQLYEDVVRLGNPVFTATFEKVNKNEIRVNGRLWDIDDYIDYLDKETDTDGAFIQELKNSFQKAKKKSTFKLLESDDRSATAPSTPTPTPQPQTNTMEPNFGTPVPAGPNHTISPGFVKYLEEEGLWP